MNRFERPIVPGEMKVRIHPRAVLPIGWKAGNYPVENVLFVKQFVVRAQRDVPRIARYHFVRPGPIRQFSNVKRDVRARTHMASEIVGQFPPRSPPEGVAVGCRYVKDLVFGPLRPWQVNIGMGKQCGQCESTPFSASSYHFGRIAVRGKRLALTLGSTPFEANEGLAPCVFRVYPPQAGASLSREAWRYPSPTVRGDVAALP